MKDLLHDGNITRVIVKDDRGKVLLKISVEVGVACTVIALWLLALCAIVVLAANCRIVVQKIARCK